MVMLVVAFVSFSLFTFVGDPVHNMVGEETSDQEREEIREALGLNDPIPVQFTRFVRKASKGNFGTSYQLRRPVSELISERLPATLELVFVSALIALISCVLILKSKEEKEYNFLKILLFLIIFFVIVVSEVSLRYSSYNIKGMLFFILFPFLSFFSIYFILIKKLNYTI